MNPAKRTNPVGIHALVWAGDTSPGSVTEAVEHTSEAGFDLLELSLHDSLSIDVEDTRRQLEQAGLAIACSRGLAFDADISSDDVEVVRRGYRLLLESLDITHRLGGTHLTGALYSALGKYGHPLTVRGRQHVVGALTDLAARARDLQMTIGLEICNRYETNVINTTREALALADDIGADNVTIHLDTYHMNIEETDFVRPVHEAGDRLGYVHVGENDRGYLGSGHIDFDAFFGALAEIGYAGPITFESFSAAVIAPGLCNDLAIWRSVWSDGPDLARQARAFIADQLERHRHRR